MKNGIARIVSDGGPRNTHVYLEDGTEIDNVVSVKWEVGVHQRSVVVLEVINVALEVQGELEVSKVERG